MDLARMLVLPRDELTGTDTADHAIEALVEREDPRGRRPRPARTRAGGVHQPRAARARRADRRRRDRRAVRARPPLEQSISHEGELTPRRNVEILQEFVRARARRQAEARGAAVPRLAGRARGRRQRRAGEAGAQRARARRRRAAARRADRASTRRIDAGLVFRSIGYKGEGIEGVPFDDWHGTIPNSRGRVLDLDDQKTIPGLYVAGWIKRGPSGVIGTNKRDAQETIDHLLDDLAEGACPEPGRHFTRGDRRAARRARPRPRDMGRVAVDRRRRGSRRRAAGPPAGEVRLRRGDARGGARAQLTRRRRRARRACARATR